MLQILPNQVIVKLLSEASPYTFGQLRAITTRYWNNSNIDMVWEERILRDFGQHSLENFKKRVQDGRIRLEMLESDEGTDASAQELERARDQIPTPEQYYKYLMLWNLGDFVRCNGHYFNEGKSVIQGLRVWFLSRHQQNFNRIDEDFAKYYIPVVNQLKTIPHPTEGNPVIFSAVIWSHLWVALILIKQGVIPESYIGDLLVEAAKHKDLRLLSALLEVGLDPNAMEGHGHNNNTWRPLMIPADTNRISAAKLLIRYGADPTLGDARGYDCPLKLARSRGHTEMVQLLEEAVVAKNFRELPF